MKFELHCHTKYSTSNIPLDGMEEPATIVRHAKRIGLAGIAITDHDVNKGWKEARLEAKKQGIIFIPGMEVSSSRGHILALGISDRIENNLSIEETVERIHESGGVAVASHPFDIRGFGVRDEFVKADAVEVFNGLSLDRFSNWLTKSRVEKAGMPVTSGSDAHTLGMIGKAGISADADDIDSLLKAIREGRVSISENYVLLNEMKEWNRLRMENAYEDVLRFIDWRFGRIRAWALKGVMNKYLATNPRNLAWEFVARAGLIGVLLYGGFKAFSYW